MMRRVCVSLSGMAHSTRLLSQCAERSPSASSHLSYSAAAHSESDAKAPESGDAKPVSFSLKNGNARLSSVDFVKKVKEAVGGDVPDEEFVIPRSAFDALAAEYDEVLEEAASLKEVQDKYTRALADTENVRRRGQKQVADSKLFAIQGFCKDLLEVADILDLAVGSMKKEEVEANPQMKSLHDGIEMTRTVMHKVFGKHGLERMEPEGDKFDPNLHEAVFQVPKAQSKYEPGCVGQVMSIGYSLQGRPIRAPKVGVVAQA